MLPDLRAYLRGLHRESLGTHQDDEHSQTAGGAKAAIDTAVAYLLLNMGQGREIVAVYEREIQTALTALMPALTDAGLGPAALEAAASVLAGAKTPSSPDQVFERSRRIAQSAETIIVSLRSAPRWRDHRTSASLLSPLYAAEEKFRAAWNAASRDLAANLPAGHSADQGVSREMLRNYFQSIYPDRPGVRVESLRALSGAHSREVYFFDLVDGAGNHEPMALRRDRAQNVTPATVAQERPIMDALRRRGFPVPEVIAASDDSRVLGRSFLAMRKIAGTELAQDSDPKRYLPQVAKLLAGLHRTATDELVFPIQLLKPPWDDAWHRLIEETYAVWAKSKPYASLTMERAYDWLRRNTHCAATNRGFVHGDYQPQNILVDRDALVGLLDYEVCHLGNPAEDLIAIRGRIEPYASWQVFFDEYLAHGGVPVSEAEMNFSTVWIPFYYSTLCATAYDTFCGRGGFDIATGAPTLLHLPQLLDFLTIAAQQLDV